MRYCPPVTCHSVGTLIAIISQLNTVPAAHDSSASLVSHRMAVKEHSVLPREAQYSRGRCESRACTFGMLSDRTPTIHRRLPVPQGRLYRVARHSIGARTHLWLLAPNIPAEPLVVVLHNRPLLLGLVDRVPESLIED